MHKIRISISLALVCVASVVGCGADLGSDDDNAESLMTVTQELPGDCSVSLVCNDGTSVSCNGTNSQCYLSPNSVKCNGASYSCPVVPPSSSPCAFNGNWYQSGYVYGATNGVYCSKKTNGHCIGGLYAGKGCVANATCYATCDNGTWLENP